MLQLSQERGDLISRQIFGVGAWPEKIYGTGQSKFEEGKKKLKIEKKNKKNSM